MYENEKKNILHLLFPSLHFVVRVAHRGTPVTVPDSVCLWRQSELSEGSHGHIHSNAMSGSYVNAENTEIEIAAKSSRDGVVSR